MKNYKAKLKINSKFKKQKIKLNCKEKVKIKKKLIMDQKCHQKILKTKTMI